ncbi:MAG: 4Fe-4S cluster-binding domain-containing protein [Bacteroidales bacterium]|jgi:MoaA/NifB/PqqE/SkfB family radical SAM enzyme|nr:4Fe-4S cluster-binding domain-containing protein [Bacteroidales bacterium]
MKASFLIFIKNLVDSYHIFYKQYCDSKKEKFLNSIRIYLTESCNANCSHCFNKNIRNEGHMSFDIAKNLFAYLKENNVCKLKMMGGEPTPSPFLFKYKYKYIKHEFK